MAAKINFEESILPDKEAEIGEWSLPMELTEMILVRLPAHDLVYYKLVCKPWRSAISSPGFMSDHFNRSKSDPASHCLLLHEDCPRPIAFTAPGPFSSVAYCLAPFVAVVGSVNGLICIVATARGRTLPGDDIWILNPVTGHIRQLPLPSKSHFIYGSDTVAFVFWWDSITGDGDGDGEYKLAKIVSKPENITDASVWVSSSPETWSEIPINFQGSFYHPPGIVSGCDIVVGDVAYWIVFDKYMDDRDVGDLFVLSLHLKTLSLKAIKFHLNFMDPKALVEHLRYKDNFYVFAVNWIGNFALVEKDETKGRYNLWTMDGNEGWRMECFFDPDFDILRCISNINGKSIFVREVDTGYTGNFGICLYDIGTREGELIDEFLLGDLVGSAHDFVGSFVSIKGFKPASNLSPSLRVIWPHPSACSMSGNMKRIGW